MHIPALTNFELFWEKSLDTKMILAWSKNVVVLAFRGTASMANVVADIQVLLFVSLTARFFLLYNILSCLQEGESASPFSCFWPAFPLTWPEPPL